MNKFKIKVLLVFSFFLYEISPVKGNSVDALLKHPPIPLLDESGMHVRDSGKPYSPKMSCGSAGCHDYDAITHAYHFEMGRDEASDDFGLKRGLPHLVSPGYFGGYACMGGSNPTVLAKKNNVNANEFADVGTPGLIKDCVSCHPGGGWMEKDRNGNRYTDTDLAKVPDFDGDYFNRGTDESNLAVGSDLVAQWDWDKSGVIEGDCMLCHADFAGLKKFDTKLGLDTGLDGSDSAYDHFRDLRRNALVEEGGYFRYAATAILEFIDLDYFGGNDVEENEQDNDIGRSLLSFEKNVDETTEEPEYQLVLGEDSLPMINWNPDAFDESGKTVIPMLRFPGNDNCMMCHLTSNSRRGFYGFGEGAEATYDGEDGPLEEDYQDDVHKGKTWTEPNGETRSIENCNACHSRNYFKKAFENVDLDADHNFLKGNSDMDVRNDLDYYQNAKTCEYCHNDAPEPAELAIPSGHADMLSAHTEIWKANGDMAYPESELTKITQTHFDVMTCQTCHITDKESRGEQLQIMYRYRIEADELKKIVPYNPKLRYYWKELSSNRVLTKTERNSVFELREDDGAEYGVIVDSAGNEMAQVGVRLSHGSTVFNDPENYDGYVALKSAYDSMFEALGVAEPNSVMVWTESNEYLISHNVRPSPSSVECEECHSRKQDGAFSSLVSTEGLFGEGNIKTVTVLPDRRLVDEGIVQLDFPYMQINDEGEVTESVADILYVTKVDPSLTVYHAATSTTVAGTLKRMTVEEALIDLGLERSSDELSPLLSGEGAYIYRANYGAPQLRAATLMFDVNGQTELLFPTYRIQITLEDSEQETAEQVVIQGGLASPVYSMKAMDKNGYSVAHFSGNLATVKIPYTGSSEVVEEVSVYTQMEGSGWQAIESDSLILVNPASNEEGAEAEGYLVFQTDQLGGFVAVDQSASLTPPPSESGAAEEGNDDDSGGGIGIMLLLLGMVGCCRYLQAQQNGPKSKASIN